MKKFAVLGVCSVALMVVCTTSAMAQGRGGGMMGGRGGKMGLVRMEQVQKELKLSEETLEKINDILEEVMPGPGGGGGGGGGPDPEAMKKAETEILGLLDDSQKKRLTGLFIQRAGSRSLTDDSVASALKIDADLKEEIQGKIEELGAGMREKMMEIFQNAGEDREAATKKAQELQAEMDKEVLALLSDDQRKMFEAMKGEKFEFPAMGRGPGGGRGGGAGGPGGGGRPGGAGEGRPQRPGGGGNDKGGGGF